LGLTVTDTVKGTPVQAPPIEGVIVYATSIGALVVLTGLPLITESPLPDAVLEIPVILGACQE
jgi:hypothetical protein